MITRHLPEPSTDHDRSPDFEGLTREAYTHLLDEVRDLRISLSKSEGDHRDTDREYRKLLRKVNENDPAPDESLRGVLSVGPFLHGEPRCCAEMDLFQERIREEVESRRVRKPFKLRVRFVNYESIPNYAKGSFGIDGEWVATLCIGSLKKEWTSTIGATYEIDVN